MMIWTENILVENLCLEIILLLAEEADHMVQAEMLVAVFLAMTMREVVSRLVSTILTEVMVLVTPRAQTEDHHLAAILLLDRLQPAHTAAMYLAVHVEVAPLLLPHPQQYLPEGPPCPPGGQHLLSPLEDLPCLLEAQHLFPPEDLPCLPEDLHPFPPEVLLCQEGAPWVVSP